MSKESNPKKESKSIERSLFAIMCIQEDGNERDAKSRLKDYDNILFTMNRLLGLDSVYRLMKDPNPDEKESEVQAQESVELKKGGTVKRKETEKMNFKTVWTAKEMLSFCKEVTDMMQKKEKETLVYDSLIFVITAPAKSDQMKNDREFERISDSFGDVTTSLPNDVYKLFVSETYPKVFMVDRYFEFDVKRDRLTGAADDPDNPNLGKSEEQIEKERKEPEQDPKIQCKRFNSQGNLSSKAWMKMDAYGTPDDFIQFYGHEGPLGMLEDDLKRGGIVTRSIGWYLKIQGIQIVDLEKGDASIQYYIGESERFIKNELLPEAHPLRYPAKGKSKIKFVLHPPGWVEF